MAARLYDTPEWKAARAGFLREHPLCAFCQTPVKRGGRRGDPLIGIVDHKQPHRGNPDLFWDRRNWQTLHKLCHDSAKQRAERTGHLVGHDASGLPLDPSHHWGPGGECHPGGTQGGHVGSPGTELEFAL